MPAVPAIHETNLQRMASFVIANGGWQYYRIPGTYHAAVSMKILDKIRKNTGRVFHTTQPDIFTSMAIPVFSKTGLHTGHPITVHGVSAKSNGGALIAREGVAVRTKYIREFDNYKIHHTLFPEGFFVSNLIADAFLVALDKFPEFYGKMIFNYEAMWAYMWQLKHASYQEIIKHRSKFNKYHSFRMPWFLFYMGLQSAVIWRRRLLNKIAKLKQSNLDVPDNIRDFARLLSRIQEGKP
jgi:hypothetical protein